MTVVRLLVSVITVGWTVVVMMMMWCTTPCWSKYKQSAAIYCFRLATTEQTWDTTQDASVLHSWSSTSVSAKGRINNPDSDCFILNHHPLGFEDFQTFLCLSVMLNRIFPGFFFFFFDSWKENTSTNCGWDFSQDYIDYRINWNNN